MKVEQLKDSLLGWGGYEDLQDKILLDKQVVYMKGSRTTGTRTVSGTFYQWQTTVNNKTFAFYTLSRTPSLGDTAFMTGRSIHGFVFKYDSTRDAIQALVPDNHADYPSVPTYFKYNSSVQSSFTVTYVQEKLYPVNIDGTSTNKAYTITIDYDDTVLNEKFFFDKHTQCLIRTAYREITDTIDNQTSSVTKQMSFSMYDPNTCQLLDKHVVYGVHNAKWDFGSDNRFENCGNGLYSFYCNGFINVWYTGTDFKKAHSATVFVYSPRYKRVSTIDVGSILPITNDLSYALFVQGLRDHYFGIHNYADSSDDLTDCVFGMHVPKYTQSIGSSTYDQYLYEVHADLTQNPAYAWTTSDPIVANTNTSYDFIWSKERYPALNSTANSIYFANSDNKLSEYIAYGLFMNGELYQKFYKLNSNSYATDTNVIPDLSNIFAGSGTATYYPKLSTSGWDGRLNVAGTNYYFDNNFYFTNNIAVNWLSTYVMSTSYYPRLFSGPKVLSSVKRIIGGGPLVQLNISSESYTIEKQYDDECYGALVSYTNMSLPVQHWIRAILVSSTSNGAKMNTGNVHSISYKGKTYYVSYSDSYETSNAVISLNNYKDLPIIYSNIAMDDRVFGVILSNITDNNPFYMTPVLLKDYNNSGAHTLTYRYLSGPNVLSCAAYDSISGNAVTTISNELSVLPLSETSMVFTSTSGIGTPRYINILRSRYIYPYITYLMPTTSKLDCNSNSAFLNDYSTSSSACLDGGFKIPPVAILDGDLKNPPITKPTHIYGWKNGNTIVYTSSLDATDVVDTTYLVRLILDNNIEFVHEVESNDTTISSITQSSLTVKSGTVYTRDDEYDWDLRLGVQKYTPTYLMPWQA